MKSVANTIDEVTVERQVMQPAASHNDLLRAV